MDETAKTEARNYLMAGGFFIWAMIFAMLFVTTLQGTFLPAGVDLIAGLTLVGIGIALVVLRKRDMAGIVFILCGLNSLFFEFCMANETDIGMGSVLIGISLILLSLVIITGNDKQKWLLFILPLLDGLQALLSTMSSGTTAAVYYLIIALVALYYACACAFERVALPGRSLLTADETTDFKASGSVIAYLMFAVLCLTWTFMYLFGTQLLSTGAAFAISNLCGWGMILAAVLLLAVGKMRFTPVMFLGVGIISLFSHLVSGPLYFILGIGIVLLGIFSIMRKESRILPGIMLIVYGATVFISVGISGGIDSQMASMLLNFIPFLISLYLAFAVFSQKKLPLV